MIAKSAVEKSCQSLGKVSQKKNGSTALFNRKIVLCCHREQKLHITFVADFNTNPMAQGRRILMTVGDFGGHHAVFL